MSEVNEVLAVQETEKSASSGALRKAWERAKPVLKTAVGGALMIGAASLTKATMVAINNPGFFVSSASEAGLAGILATNATILGVGGASLMKEPVRNAFNFFKGSSKK